MSSSSECFLALHFWFIMRYSFNFSSNLARKYNKTCSKQVYFASFLGFIVSFFNCYVLLKQGESKETDVLHCTYIFTETFAHRRKKESIGYVPKYCFGECLHFSTMWMQTILTGKFIWELRWTFFGPGSSASCGFIEKFVTWGQLWPLYLRDLAVPPYMRGMR